MGEEWDTLLEDYPFLKDFDEKKKKHISIKDYTAFYNIEND
jgi:hypothetical protein